MIAAREKAESFLALHSQQKAFVMPNPWDLGTARILTTLGFQALATTSAGFSFSQGQKDGTISRTKTLIHIAEIAEGTHLPVSADLGNGFGDSPEAVNETIRLAGSSGIVGGSVEDASGLKAAPIYERVLAIERITAAVEAARKLPYHFTLTARCENFLYGSGSLSDTIDRLQRYQEAGADVLYAPGLKSKEEITAVLRSVDKPLNVLLGIRGVSLTVNELSALGVKRISIGSALSRATLAAFVNGARELLETGTFTFAQSALSLTEANNLFSP